MGYENLLSYYPTYSILDEVVSETGCKKLNLFFDLRNNLQTTYMKHAIEGIIDTSLKSKFVDTSIFIFSLNLDILIIILIFGKNIRYLEEQMIYMD
jgi:hypothetical protein